MAKLKLKLDTQKIKQMLTTRMEIVGLAVAGLLVFICLVWGFINFVGTSSQEAKIRADADKMRAQHQGAPVPDITRPVKDGLLDWPGVQGKDANLAYFPYIVPGTTSAGNRFNPTIVTVDNDAEGRAFQFDYLLRAVMTYNAVGGSIEVFTDKGGDKGAASEPVISPAGKRLIVVSGTFPYREQVNHFCKALGMSVEDLFTKGLAPTFEGLNIQRRKVTFKDGQPEGVWEPFDPTNTSNKFSKATKELLRTAVYDLGEVDKYHDIIYGASVMPLPKLMGGKGYPDILLPALANRTGAKPGGDRYLPFGPKPAQTLPAASEKDRPTDAAEFKNLPAHMKEQINGNINWFSPYGTFAEEQAKQAKPGDNFQIEPKKDGKGSDTADAKPNYKAPAGLPGHPKALIRFFDVDVEPGAYYQYQIQVRMANPNFGQTTKVVANIAWTKDPVLLSKWVETPVYGPIPGEQEFYITNRDKGFVSKFKAGPKSAGIDTATNSAISDKQVPFQVHRFFEAASTSDRNTHIVADWVIAERLLVARGETIGRECEMELADWKKERTKWELFRSSGVKIDFRIVPPVTLLDFTGGKQKYTNPKTGSPMPEEDSSIEALLLMPDGTMQLRNGRHDADEQAGANVLNQLRLERYHVWKDRMEKLMQPPAKTDKK